MSENRGSSSGAFIAGALIGGAIGAITGLLLAPRSGQETRQLLKKSADALPELAEDLSSSVQIQADRLSGSALRNWDSTLNRLREAMRAGAQAASNAARMEASQTEAIAERGRSRSTDSPEDLPALEPRPVARDPHQS